MELKSYRTVNWLVLGAYLLAIAMIVYPVYARGHETMGTWGIHGYSDYLYGHKIGNAPDVGPVNCCLYRSPEGKIGDCRQIDEAQVKIVPGGYEWDGEFIPHSETNVSPKHPHTGDYHFYACKHDAGGPWGPNPKTHCFFAPPRGS